MPGDPEGAFDHPPTRLKVGQWTVTPALNQLEHNGDVAKLEPRAMDLLIYLAKAHPRVVSAEELLRAVWQGRAFDDGIVYRKINQLRKSLGDDSSNVKFIQTIPKRGYRLIAAVVRDSAAETTATHADAAEARGPVAALPEGLNSLAEQSRTTANRKWWWLTLAASVVAGAVALGALAPWRGVEAPPRLLVTGQPFTFVTSERGDETEPAWNQDGTRVAFVRDTVEGLSGIYVTEIGSTERVPLTTLREGVVRSPRWSPVKPEIAFLRQQDQTTFDLVVVSALPGGTERPLATLRGPIVALETFPMFTWTPDGRLAFSTLKEGAAQEYASYLLSPTGAVELLGLGAGPDNYDTSPAFSPDGARLAFVRHRVGERWPRLMMVELGPGLKPRAAPQLVPGVPPIGNPQSPVWSPDGETLTFLIGQRMFEWRVGGATQAIYALQMFPAGLDMLWRDGRARAVVALSPGNLDIWALPLDPVAHVAPGGLESAVLRIDSAASERSMDFSPDGHKLAYTANVSGRFQLWLADTHGGARHPLTDLPGPVMSVPQWSPDGKQIAFSEAQPTGTFVTYVIDVEAGPPTPLFDGYLTDWAVDGYLYAFLLGNPPAGFRYQLATGVIEELFTDGGVVDGTDLLHTKGVRTWGIFARSLVGDVASNPERLLVDDYYPARGKIVPVVGGFYYICHSKTGAPRAFCFYDYATQKSHDVARAPKSIDIGMAVSPDGTELLYPANAPGAGFNLRMIEFDVR